jgi:hypothetical protein
MLHLYPLARAACLALLCSAILLFTGAPPAAAQDALPTAGYGYCFPYAPKEVEGNSAILRLTNSAASDATIIVMYYNPDGTQGAPSQVYSLNTGGSRTVNLGTNPNLPAGKYQVVVASSGPLAGVAMIRNSTTGAFGLYRPTNCASISDTQFGFFTAGAADGTTSTLYLTQGGNQAASLQLQVLDNAGNVLYTKPNVNLLPGAGLTFSSADVPAHITLPGGVGRIRVSTATKGIAGVLARQRNGSTSFANAAMTQSNALHALADPAVPNKNALPRLYNGVQIGGATFTTHLLFASGTSATSNTFSVSFYNEDGSSAATPLMYTLTNGGAVSILGLTNAPSATMSAVTGSQDSLGQQADLVEQGSGRASYAVNSLLFAEYSTTIVIPFAMLDDTTNSVISAQNLAPLSQQISIDLITDEGQKVQTLQRTVNAGAAFVLDLQSIQGLATPFTGMAVIKGSEEMAAQLDTFTSLAAEPLTGVAVEGPALARIGDASVLTATILPPGAARPITYTWQLDGQTFAPVVSSSTRNSRTFNWPVPGLHLITVTAANAMSEASGEHLVTVAADSETVKPGAPTVLSQATQDGTSIGLSVPSGGATEGYTLTLSPVTINQLGDIYDVPQYTAPLGTGSLLDAYSNAQLQSAASAPAVQPLPDYTFAKPATLSVRYPSAAVSVWDENGLRILIRTGGKWVDAASTCNPASTYTRRPAQNEIIVDICRTGPFVIVAASEFLFLPSLSDR